MTRIAENLRAYHPKALVLFGSMARTLAGDPGNRPPNDVDLLLVTNNPVMPPSMKRGTTGNILIGWRKHQREALKWLLKQEKKSSKK